MSDFVTKEDFEKLKKEIMGAEENTDENTEENTDKNTDKNTDGNTEENTDGNKKNLDDARKINEMVGLSDAQRKALINAADREISQQKRKEQLSKYKKRVEGLAKNEKIPEDAKKTIKTMIEKGMVDEMLEFNPSIRYAAEENLEQFSDIFFSTAETLMNRKNKTGSNKPNNNDSSNQKHYTRSKAINTDNTHSDEDKVDLEAEDVIEKLRKECNLSEMQLVKLGLAHKIGKKQMKRFNN